MTKKEIILDKIMNPRFRIASYRWTNTRNNERIVCATRIAALWAGTIRLGGETSAYWPELDALMKRDVAEFAAAAMADKSDAWMRGITELAERAKKVDDDTVAQEVAFNSIRLFFRLDEALLASWALRSAGRADEGARVAAEWSKPLARFEKDLRLFTLAESHARPIADNFRTDLAAYDSDLYFISGIYETLIAEARKTSPARESVTAAPAVVSPLSIVAGVVNKHIDNLASRLLSFRDAFAASQQVAFSAHAEGADDAAEASDMTDIPLNILGDGGKWSCDLKFTDAGGIQLIAMDAEGMPLANAVLKIGDVRRTTGEDGSATMSFEELERNIASSAPTIEWEGTPAQPGKWMAYDKS